MNTSAPWKRLLTRSAVANVATLLALLALAMALLPFHDDAWWPAAPGAARWIGATIATALYLAASGWLLWRARPRRVHALNHGSDPNDDSPLLVAWASQTGFAQQLAERTASTLAGAGMNVQLRDLADVDAVMLRSFDRALFITSTTGEGDPPDHASAFVRDVLAMPVALPALKFAVLALGDNSYDQYCGFGRRLEQWLRQSGAQSLFDMIEVDNGDDGALRHWQHHLGLLADAPELPDWSPVVYQSWRLRERVEINPGSAGEPAFHIALTAPRGSSSTWQAGDIAEIGPRNSAQAVETLLAQLGFPSTAHVQRDGEDVALRDVLARSHLPDPETMRSVDAQAFADVLQPLPHRAYSIASLPQDGSLQLLVRCMRRADGRLGLGSGWLCQHARVGDEIALRIRSNPNFHAPALTRPMILVGNGTGIAGLRAHLKARIDGGARRNWLLFGERNRDRDFFHHAQIQSWQADGFIERLDTAFSRDGARKYYVQDALRDAGPALRAWIDDGAAIHVCGSLQGMAPGVDAVLRETVGDARVEQMLANGRYRRDVY